MGKICGKQLIYAMILMLGALTFGYVMAYPSTAVKQLDDDFGNLTDFQKSFFNSVSSLGAIPGPFITAAMLKYIGRRPMTFMVSLFGTGCWLLMLILNKERFWLGIVDRGLLGLTIGMFSSVIPMYIVELAPPEATGFYGSFNQLGVTIGIDICYLVGAYVGWKETAIVGCGLTVLLDILVWFVPESPAAGQATNEGKLTDVFERQWLKPLIISVSTMIFQQWCGVNGIVTNLDGLFEDAGVTMKLRSVIAGFASVVAVLIGAFMIQALGRKAVWNISYMGTGISSVLYGLCVQDNLKDKFPSWTPIMFVFLFQLAFGLGAGPIPWFIASELFPSSVRASAASMVSITNWTMAFAVIQSFPYMQDGLTTFGVFMLFAAWSFGSVVFGFAYIKEPDTQNDYDRIGESKEQVWSLAGATYQ